jgi:protease II
MISTVVEEDVSQDGHPLETNPKLLLRFFVGYVIYMQETVEGDAEVLLDPNTWSEDGTVALATMDFSHDAKYVAYGQSASGSDWITIKVMHVADRVVQPDTLSWVRLYCRLLVLWS